MTAKTFSVNLLREETNTLSVHTMNDYCMANRKVTAPQPLFGCFAKAIKNHTVCDLGVYIKGPQKCFSK